jgi:hypothetical protein
MRMKRKLGIFAALSLAAAVSVAGVAMAGSASQGTVTQSLEAALTPTSVPKKGTPKAGKIAVGVEVTDSQPGQSAPPATKVDIAFDEDIFFTTKGLATCTTQEIVQLRSDAARSKCKKAYIGADGPPVLPSSTETNSALAQCGTTGDPAATIPTVVSAFNGPMKGKNPTLLLHADATPPGAGTAIVQVLEGTLIKTPGPGPGERAKAPKPQSRTLSVQVPPLAGGACAIKRFEATIAKKFTIRKRGKKVKQNYISQICSDGTWNFDGEFTFNPDPSVNPTGVQTLSPTDEVACRGK